MTGRNDKAQEARLWAALGASLAGLVVTTIFVQPPNPIAIGPWMSIAVGVLFGIGVTRSKREGDDS